MKNLLYLLVAVALLGSVSSVMAEPTPATSDKPAVTSGGSAVGFWGDLPIGKSGIALGVGIGAGLIVMGAARGIGNIGASAVEAIARQPEAGGRIFTSMLLSAALIEGFTFFALLIQFTLK